MIDAKEELKSQAKLLGFELMGVARASEADGFARFEEWLDRGFAGEMKYLQNHRQARKHPESVLAGVHSVLMLGITYQPTLANRSGIRVARYAQAPDYHEYLWNRLDELVAWQLAQFPNSQARGVVDSAPLLERDFARRAGLGWFGKNTMLIHKQRGSFFLLCALLTTLELEPDTPHFKSHCGTCTACLDACPTHALVEPGWLDAKLCISYLTIELRGSIPEELRPQIGDWLFGCDICQEVCPWNRPRSNAPNSAIPAHGLPHRPDLVEIDPVELLSLDDKSFRNRFRGTSFTRSKRRGLLRNAAIVLANRRDKQALPGLQLLAKDPDTMLQEVANWAIQQIEASENQAV